MAMFEKVIHRKSRRDYLSDYQKNVSGEYMYVGARYKFSSLSGKTRKQWMHKMLLLNIAAMIASIIPGCIRVPGMDYSAYVLLPYVVALLTTGYTLMAAIRLACAKDDVKAWEYDKSVKALPVCSKIIVVLAAIAVIGEIVYVAINGCGKFLFGTVVFLVCHLLLGVCGVLMSGHTKDAEWELITD